MLCAFKECAVLWGGHMQTSSSVIRGSPPCLEHTEAAASWWATLGLEE